jgi:hypothetical protein
LDLLITYFNSKYKDKNIRLLYSTPNIYIDALDESQNALDINWPINYEDFFPYTEEGKTYWSGYYTSRPIIKDTIKRFSQFLHASSKLYSLYSSMYIIK